MTIWDLCIKRPVFTVMLVSAPIVLGLVSYSRLGIDLLPNVEMPIVSVTTTLKGASVEEMETSVTKPLEEIINTVSGIDELRSTTKEGISLISVVFFLEKNRDVAAQEVRDKISTVLNQLPEGTDTPILDKIDLNAAPVMTIAVSGDRPMQEITEIARKRVKEDLESIYGVGAVILAGGRPRAVNIYVDTDKLTAYNLSVDEVRGALIRQNLEVPGGRVDQGTQEVVLRTMGRVATPADFRDLIIANQGGFPVRIRDVGRVEDTFEEPRSLARLDGRNAVSLIVQKQSGTNTVAVVENVKKRLAQLQGSLPPDIRTFVVKDQSKFIVRSFEELKLHLVIAAVLVGATILFFIQDWRTTVIATMSIPASIIATFAFMDYRGLTLNNMTMLGLILAVGIVIDDAVVVHENIFRHMEEHGRKGRAAASTATKEIALPVVATTMSLLVIFVPIVFMGGKVGLFFSSFGLVVAFAIFMSMCVSFTMTPMLCSRFLKMEKRRKGSKSGPVWRAVDGFYGVVLGWSLRHRWAIVATTIVLFASTPLLFKSVGFEFLPRDDQSEFEVAITTPSGYSLDKVDRTFAEIEAEIRKLRGVETVFTTIGDTTGRMSRGLGEVTTGTIYARLTDLEHRVHPWYDVRNWFRVLSGRPDDTTRFFSQFDVQREAREIVERYPELRTAVQDVAVVTAAGFRQSMIDFNLRGPDLNKLEEYAGRLMDWMREQKKEPSLSSKLLAFVGVKSKAEEERAYVDVDTSRVDPKREWRVRIDRERASDLDIPVQTIASTLNVLVGGEPISKYKEGDEQYDVWLRADLPYRDKMDNVARLMVSSPKAGLVQLSTLARLEEAMGPPTIERFAMQRQIVVTANLEGKALGDAKREIIDFVQSMNLPPEYRYEFLGKAKMLGESNLNFLVAFLTSFLFMYMILGAQFESFIHPVTILLALPLTLPFAILSLLMLRTSLDLYAMMGLFMLFGIVKKNGILQVDYTNVLRGRGMARNEAILEANHTRLRPILMTTVMLIAAMVPIALGQGPGAASRASLAKVILGGQTLSLLLTLLVTPVAYSLWDDLGNLASRWFGRAGEAGPESEAEPEREAEPEEAQQPAAALGRGSPIERSGGPHLRRGNGAGEDSDLDEVERVA